MLIAPRNSDCAARLPGTTYGAGVERVPRKRAGDVFCASQLDRCLRLIAHIADEAEVEHLTNQHQFSWHSFFQPIEQFIM